MRHDTTRTCAGIFFICIQKMSQRCHLSHSRPFLLVCSHQIAERQKNTNKKANSIEHHLARNHQTGENNCFCVHLINTQIKNNWFRLFFLRLCTMFVFCVRLLVVHSQRTNKKEDVILVQFCIGPCVSKTSHIDKQSISRYLAFAIKKLIYFFSDANACCLVFMLATGHD